jgi:hypothetical protein
MTSQTVAAPLPPAVAGLSEMERIVDTFVAPSKTFTDILRSASWWGPLILLILFGTASTFVVQKQVGFDRVYMNQLHASPNQEDRINSLAPDQKAHALELGARITAYFAYGAPVLVLVILALYSLVLWGAFNFGLGASTRFSQVFAVSMYGALPYLILNLLIVATIYFGGNAEGFEYKNPVGTNPAYFMPDAAGWLKGLLSSFDLIKLWSVWLQVIGMAIISKKTMAQSAVVVGIFWLLGVLFATATGAFGG